MPSYNPQPFVKVNGVTWTSDTLEGITITMGRNNINEQPRAGYASVNIVTNNGQTAPAFNIDDTLEIGVKDTSNANKILYTGRISDIRVTLSAYGGTGYLTNTQVTAVGIIAIVNRKAVGANGYPVIENDGVRVQKIISDALAFTYVTYGTYYNNPAYNTLAIATQTWNSVDVLLDTFDPGDYAIRAYSGGATNAYNLAATVASSGGGVIYETTDGRIGYKEAEARQQTSTFHDIPGDTILADGLETTKSLGDIANKITLQYGTNQSVTGTDNDSITQYGELSASVSTELFDTSAANAFLDYYLQIKSRSKPIFERFIIGLHLDNMANPLRDDLLDVFTNMGIRTSDLPTSIYPEDFIGFVEGWTWTINRKEIFLSLSVSDYLLSIIAQQYQQVSAVEAWNTVSATLQWQEARIVA